MKHFLLFCSALAFSLPALSEPFTYAPETCEFQITFPEKPFIEKKCAADGKECSEIVTYTKAIGAEASTNFRISCNPISSTDMEKYTPSILEETLKQMSKSSGLQPYDTRSDEKDGYKSASSLSLSERDGKGLIHNGQIWAGKKSLFTMESEMIGTQNDEIEKIFVGIMKSAYPKDRSPIIDKKKLPTTKATEKEKTSP